MKRNLFLLFIFVIPIFMFSLSANASFNFLRYHDGRPVNIDLSEGIVTDADEENPEVVKRLESMEKTEKDVGESVWMLLVPKKARGGYRQDTGPQLSFGSCVAISPEDPALEMDKFDMDLMKNMGVSSKNYDKNATYMDTNFHVVAQWREEDDMPLQVKKIFRTLEGETKIVTYDVELASIAPREDLALIKVPGIKIPTLALGDLSKASDYEKRRGYRVVAIGSPYTMEGTYSEGKVFYPAKNIVTIYNFFELVADYPLDEIRYQTNADINPGNSGGLLAGMAGENKNKIIGKPCSGYSGSCINFAIPDFTLKRMLPQLLKNKVHRPAYTGLIVCDPKMVSGSDKTRKAFFDGLGLKSAYYKVKEKSGALVVGFMKDSPFKEKQVHPIYRSQYQREIKIDPATVILYGDIITAINDKEINDPDNFLEELRKVKSKNIEFKLTRFVKKIKDRAEEWEEKEFVIHRTKKELTISDQKYRMIYQSYHKEDGMLINMEIMRKNVPIKNSIVLH